MVDIVNENLVYSILDLVRKELKKDHSDHGSSTPFNDVPSAVLFREHPQSDVVVTKVELNYSGDYLAQVHLIYGGMGNPFILDRVALIGYKYGDDEELEELIRYYIILSRDERGLLTGVDVISGTGDEEEP